MSNGNGARGTDVIRLATGQSPRLAENDKKEIENKGKKRKLRFSRGPSRAELISIEARLASCRNG